MGEVLRGKEVYKIRYFDMNLHVIGAQYIIVLCELGER